MPETEPDDPQWMVWMDLATQAVPVGGDNFAFIIGVRGHNGTWFAHFGGIEVDGHPKWSVPSIIETLRKRAEGEMAKLGNELEVNSKVLRDLPKVWVPEVVEE